jgi:hypothetical protein
MDEFDDIDFSESDQSAAVEGSTNPLRNPRVAKSVTADTTRQNLILFRQKTQNANVLNRLRKNVLLIKILA